MRTETSRERDGHGSDRWTALGLAAGFLALYLRTLCPTVYLGDVGDFCTAVVTGGVPHAPGYPLFSLLGRAALVLVPVGEPAFRIGCVVALAAAGAVAALFALIRELGCARWSAATAAATFGVGYTFWSQSTRVEVYSLHMLLLTTALWLACRYRRTGSVWDVAVAALCGSLGMANHLTIVHALPSVLILCGARLWKDPGVGRRLALLLALLPIGPALYSLLVVWARAEPLHAWGQTVDLPALWNHASARFYRATLFRPPGGAELIERLAQAGALYNDNFPYLLCVPPVAGAWLLWRRNRAMAGALLLLASVVVAYNQCYHILDIAGYYLPVWMVAAALLAVTLDQAPRLAPRAMPGALLAGVLTAAIVGAQVQRNWVACDLSRATWVRDTARYKLEAAAPNGVLITDSLEDLFPIWYVQDVLKLRPDVAVVNRMELRYAWTYHEWEPSLWYLHRLRRKGIPAPLEVPADRERRVAFGDGEYLARLLTRELRGRPAYTTFMIPRERQLDPTPYFVQWVRQHYLTVPMGLLLRLHPKQQPLRLADVLQQNERLWAGITLPDLWGVRTDQELLPDYHARHYATMLYNRGLLYDMADDPARGDAVRRQVTAWAPKLFPEAPRQSARAPVSPDAVTR
jgi:hypothetical protein